MTGRLLITAVSVTLCLGLAVVLVGKLGYATNRISPYRVLAYDSVEPAASLRRRVQDSLQPDPLSFDRAAARQLARAEPLDSLPYLAFLTRSVASADYTASEALSAQILLRAPRNRVAWLARLSVAIEKGRSDEAINALSRLYTLDPERREQYIAALSEIGLVSSERPFFLSALAEKPPWGLAVADRLIDMSEDNSLVLALLSIYSERQGRYLEKLVQQDEWKSAYVAFVSFLPPDRRFAMSTPFDPHFEGNSAPRPFNWLLNADFAGLEQRGGLAVDFPGQRRVWLATQVVALPPGRYRLSASMMGQTSLDGGYFRWEAACVEGGQIARLDVTELLPTERTYTNGFEVPGDSCAFQRLLLLGMGGAFPKSAHATISGVSIDPVSLPG